MKHLLAFDFDHTVINDNSDTYIVKLSPGGVLPENIKQLYDANGWTKFMGAIFQYLHKEGIQKEDYTNCLKDIELTSGMRELLEYLSSDAFEVIIISDANSVFINDILKYLKLDHIVKAVFTNPAQFDEDGCLRVEHFHDQDWCELSTRNLCKGTILKDYIAERRTQGIEFCRISYIGDGGNDLCPSLILSEKDFCFPRRKFRLMSEIDKLLREDKCLIKAKIVPWDSGMDILECLRSIT